MLGPRWFEALCFLFAVGFALASVFSLAHSLVTALAWFLTFSVTFTFALALRSERLETRMEFLHKPELIKAANILLIVFLFWAALEFILAMNEEDGLEPDSKWITVIGALMGAHWSYLLSNILQRFADTEERNERSLLNPIGEIA